MATIKTLETLPPLGIDAEKLHLYKSFYWQLVESSEPIPLTPQEEDKFRGDFFSLLTVKKVPTEAFLATMVANRIPSPMEYEGTLSILRLPSIALIQSIETVYSTTEI